MTAILYEDFAVPKFAGSTGDVTISDIPGISYSFGSGVANSRGARYLEDCGKGGIFHRIPPIKN